MSENKRKLGWFVRVLSGVMAAAMWWVVYQIFTDPEPIQLDVLSIGQIVASIIMFCTLVAFTIGALFGEIPITLLKVMSRGKYDPNKNS